MDNILTKINDSLLIKIESKITGKIHFVSFSDSVSGETSTRFLEKKFRISQDGIFWTDWNLLTNENLAKKEYKSDNLIFIQLQYTRKGIDTTGEIIFNNINFSGTRKELSFIAPTLENSIFSGELKNSKLGILERNIFKKLYYRGILPEYIERAKNDSYDEDKDFVDLFFSISRFFALFTIFFRRWENFKDDYELLKEQIKGYGIYFNESEITLEELQYLSQNLFSQAQQRGTKMIFSRKNETDGEFLRLTRNKESDELLYEKIPNWKTGWCLGESSPMYKGTSFAYNLNKTKENSEDFQNLNNFVLSQSGGSSYSLVTDSNNKTVLRLYLSGITGKVGLGRQSETIDVSNNLYVIDTQLDYEITFSFKINSSSDLSVLKLIFQIEGFDINKNKLNNSFVTPNGYNISETFLNESMSHWKIGQWYFVRGIIHSYASKNITSESLNIGFGNNLYFNNSFVKYIIPKIQIYNSVSNTSLTSQIDIWNYKIRPLIRGKNIISLKNNKIDNRSLGFIQSPNFFYTYFRNNNNNQSESEITNIIERYLYTFNNINLFTILKND